MNYKWQITSTPEYAPSYRGSICPPEQVGLKIPVFYNAALHTSISGSHCSSKTWGTTYTATKCHIPGEWNPHLGRFQPFRGHKGS